MPMPGKEISHVLIIVAVLGTAALIAGMWVGDWALANLDQYITKLFR